MSILLFLVLGIIAFFLINYLGGKAHSTILPKRSLRWRIRKEHSIQYRLSHHCPRRRPHPLWCPLLFCWPPFPILVSFDLWRNLLDPSHFGMGVKAPNRSL